MRSMLKSALAGLVLLGAVASAAPMPTPLARLLDALSRDLPESAIAPVDSIVHAAEARRDWPAAVHALTLRVALESAADADHDEGRIHRMTAAMDSAPAPMRPVLEAVLANWYRQYFDVNRWRISQRTEAVAVVDTDLTTWDAMRLYAATSAHFEHALAAERELLRVRASDYAAMFPGGSAPESYRPTLFDLVAHEALAFYESHEAPGVRPEHPFELRAEGAAFASREEFRRWVIDTPDSASAVWRALRIHQRLLAAHAADADPSAEIDADLWRLQYVRAHVAGDSVAAREAAALERIAERDATHELSARALHSLASIRREQGDVVAARTLALRGARRFPNSVGGRRCMNLVAEIEAPSLALVSQDDVWNVPTPVIQVTYRNLRRVYFRLLPYDMDDGVTEEWMYGWQPTDWKHLARRHPARRWWVDLPVTTDWRERTERVPVPAGLPRGAWCLVASARADFEDDDNVVQATYVQVSGLNVVLRRGRSDGVEGFVLDAASGAPVAGASVQTWVRTPRNRKLVRGAVLHTDANGEFCIDPSRAIAVLEAVHSRSHLFVRCQRGYAPQDHEARSMTQLFTDRAIYRPGQDIRYEGICMRLDELHDDYRTLPACSVTVVLRDANNTERERAVHATNANGSFSGRFTAPREGLRGSMSLAVVDGPPGYAFARVEEYKRPRFVVALDAPEEAPRLGVPVTLTGRATAYAGVPVDGASVAWRVTRNVRYASWWYAWGRGGGAGSQAVAHGTATTGAGGRFTVTFAADDDTSADATGEPSFVYTLAADVTDGAGETRAAQRSIVVGRTTMRAELYAPEWLEAGRPVPLVLRTTTLDGRPRAARGAVTIERLHAPPVTRAAEATTDYGELRHGGFEHRDGGCTPPPPDLVQPLAWDADGVADERTVATDSAGTDSLALHLAAGDYRARFRGRDEGGHEVTAVMALRVVDPSASRCALAVRDLFVARDSQVAPGGTYVAVWGTGYPEGHAYIEVECAGRVLQACWTRADETQVTIRQAVTADMRGGFTVRVMHVVENRAYLTERFVDVPWDRTLDVRWEHFVSKLEPRAKETWTAVVSRADATRANAEVVATLYDASLDVFQPLAWPDVPAFRRNDDSRSPWAPRDRAWFRQVAGGWNVPTVDAGLSYPGLSQALLHGDYGYGAGVSPRRHGGRAVRPRVGAPRPGKGQVTGIIENAGYGAAAFVNVIVLGAKLGTMTDERGGYVLTDLAPGRYTLRAVQVGCDPIQQSVVVEAGRTVTADFRFKIRRVTGSLEELEVRVSTTKQSLSADKLRELPVDNLTQAAVADGGLHFRGGRSGEVKFDVSGNGLPPLQETTPEAVVTRRDLRETAFFLPQVATAEDGTVRLEFTVPEALTEWRFMAFAHDRELRSGTLEARAVTSLDLMVQPNPPRFVREGDEVEFTATVTNRATAPRRGHVMLTLTDAIADAAADVALGNDRPERTVDVPASGSRTVAWRLHVPDGTGVLRYRVVATAPGASDGQDGWLPVLARRVLLTESLPLPIRGAGERRFEFTHLRHSAESPTLLHHALTVQMVSNPAWFAVLALPVLMEQPWESADATFDRLYANALGAHIVAARPEIRRTFARWLGTAALDSPLEQDEALKSVLLTETPWVRDAESESRRRRRVALLFDHDAMAARTAQTVARLDRMQLDNGLWPWFPGGKADVHMSLAITAGFGRLRHLGVDLTTEGPVRALRALDDWAGRQSRGTRGDLAGALTPDLALYLYGRTFFLGDRRIERRDQRAFEFWLGQARDHGLEIPDRQVRAMLALALDRTGDSTSARALMRSVAQHAVRDPVLGTYWRDPERSWWWYRQPIEGQALVIEAFDEVLHDSSMVESCRTWLLEQKHTSDWGSSRATADAVYALLLRGSDVLARRERVRVALGDAWLEPEAVQAGTGAYEVRVAGDAVRADMAAVRVAKRDAGVAWGSVHWQYFEDLAHVAPYAGTPLTLEKQLFVRATGADGRPTMRPVDGDVHPGDELVARLVLRTNRDLEYVHLEDGRGSGTEPANVLSGWRWQDGLGYYEETRDAASHFFIGWLPAGTHVFEYPVRVQLRGRYASGVASVQCLYAPEFNAHSASTLLVAR